MHASRSGGQELSDTLVKVNAQELVDALHETQPEVKAYTLTEYRSV